jgi:glycosyltransferase involved in cell wall biosynthesis
MKHILIVITNFRHGGTNKSLQNLTALLGNNNGKYKIDVFAMEHFGPYLSLLPNCNILAKDKWIEALIARYDDTKGIVRLRSLLIKVLRNICQIVNFNFTAHLFKRKAQQFSKINYDSVIAFSEGVPTLFVSYMNNTNKIAWIHCNYNSYLKLNNYPDEQTIYESFTSVVCVSKYTKQEFLKHFPSMTINTYGIHNVLDTPFIIYASKENITDPRFTTNQFNILSIGRIDPVKRFSKIPEMVRSLLNRNCQFKWYIIGGIGQYDEYFELKENMKRYDTDNSLIWLGEKNNPYPYLAQSDLLVNTSFSEACPNVINEAKILHIPVVCANFGSATEFIENGVNGYIVPLEQMVDKIELLIKNKDEYNKIKENISHFVYENDEILEKVKKLL